MKNLQIVSTPDSLNGGLETWFVQNNLFQGAPFSFGVLPQQGLGDLIIYLELNQINLDLIRHVKSLGKKIVLYHMGGEKLNKDISAYSECDLVVRNYYFKEIINESFLDGKVIWAPNGFRTGVGPRPKERLKIAESRQSHASFLGWINNTGSYKNERVSFAEVCSRCDDLYLLPSTGFAGGYNVGLYSAIMEDSIFAPCPAGNNSETIRLYDALELGCIPISLSHDFLSSKDALALAGPVPFPILNSWSELPSFLERSKKNILANSNEINELQEKCTSWWKNYKIAIQKKIDDRLDLL
jgi:hypothetical protein